MKRILSVIVALSVLLISLSSCAEPDVLNIGFNGIAVGRLPEVLFGVKSDKTEFDIDM